MSRSLFNLGVSLLAAPSLALAAPVQEIADNSVDRSRIEQVVVELIEQEGGTRHIETSSGIGVVSTVVTYYDASSPNPKLALIAQRKAWIETGLRARAGLVEFFEGLDIAARTDLADSFETEDTNEISRVKAEGSLEERIASHTEGVLRGAVTYRVDDDPAEGKVVISMVSTPKTRRGVRASSSRGLTVADYVAGEQFLIDELKKGVIPPEGVRIMTVPTTGETAWVGFGSDLIKSKEPRLKGKAITAAKKVAKARGLVCLQRVLRGESLSAGDLIDASYADSIESLENLLEGTAEVEASARATTVSAGEINSITSGKVTGGLTERYFTSADGNWMYYICAHREAKVDPKAKPSSSLAAQVIKEVGSREVAASSDCDSARAGIVRKLGVGEGPTRAIALKAALVEAIERGSGVTLESSAAIQQQFKDSISDINGKIDSFIHAESDFKENISTYTNGFIRTYDVLEEFHSPEGGAYRIQVCAEMVVYDPSNPHPGRRPTIAVLPFEQGKYAEASDAESLRGEIVSQLVKWGGYTVLSREHLSDIKGMQAEVRQGLESGQMERSEQLKLGHILSADYVIVGKVDMLHYREWDEFIRARNTSEARQELRVMSSCRLLNIATGSLIATDEVEHSWDAIALSGEPRGAPRTIALTYASAAHMQAIADALDKERERGILRVIDADGKNLVLMAEVVSANPGDSLNAYRVSEKFIAGKTIRIEKPIGRVQVIRVDRTQGPVLVYVLVIEGEGFAEGDVCRQD